MMDEFGLAAGDCVRGDHAVIRHAIQHGKSFLQFSLGAGLRLCFKNVFLYGIAARTVPAITKTGLGVGSHPLDV